MANGKRTKKRLLSAGIGVAAFTAIEGLACGNPVEPRGPSPRIEPPDAAVIDGDLPEAAPENKP